MAKEEFIPLDYDYIDSDDSCLVRIWGRAKSGKRVCILDKTDSYFWLIPKAKADLEKYAEKVKKVHLNHAGREARVLDVKIKEKNLLGKPIKALQVFVSNPKDIGAIKDIVKEFPETEDKKECDINFITRYIIDKKIIPLETYCVEGRELGKEELKEKGWNWNVDSVIRADKIYPAKWDFEPKIIAFDIETSEFEIGKGEIVMLSFANKNVKKILTFKKFENPPEEIEFVKNEKELIQRFAEFISEYKPDFLVGYFSDAFDLPYLRMRAEENDVRLNIGLDGKGITFMRGALTSSEIRGLVHIDLYKFINNIISYSLQSETISLNDVAKELLGEEKVKVDLSAISKELKSTKGKLKDAEMRKFSLYNLQDSILTAKLFEKLWPNIMELTKLVEEPLFDVNRQTYSNLVEHNIMHNASRFNEIIENRPSYDESGERRQRPKYIGAFVKEPIPGLYENVGVFDFRSFWPSIIVSFNISKPTIHEKKESGDYETPEFEFDGRKRKFYFAKKLGFIPQILSELLEKRKLVKQELKKNRIPVLEARDYALKTLSNATYGYFGFFGARYYSPEGAASATAISRYYIHKTIDDLEKAGFNVIYSDSVAGKTKVLIKKGNKISEEEIKNLFENVNQNNFGKEYNFKEGTEVLTLNQKGDSVFMPMKYVMRHKCNKKMYRINFTNNWHIDVTEDHSLIGYQAINFNQSKENRMNPLKRIIEVKPQEINKKLNSIITLKSLPYENFEDKGYPKEVYEFMGYFIGDGSFMRNKANKEANKDYYVRLSLGSDQEEILNRLITPLKTLGYIKNSWLSKTRKGDLTLNGLKLVKLISNNCRDKEGKKIIPKWLFEEKEENITAFLRGLFSADGCVMMRSGNPIIKYTSIYDSYIEEVRKLLYRVGISHSVFKENSVNQYKSKTRVYSSGSHSKNILIKNKEDFCRKIGFLLERKNKLANIKTKGMQKKSIENFGFDIQYVKNIELIKTPEYVYDIEVEGNHRFFANYVLVHNTDSIMFSFDNKKDEALSMLKKINESLPGTMELEVENFYKRGIFVLKRTGELGAKKKYALLSDKGEIKVRGFETVRRDRCKLAKETQDYVLKAVLEEGNSKNALDYVEKVVKQLKEKKIAIEQLVIKTQLKKEIESYESIGPHVIVAKKMRERGLPVKEGSLIEFVIAKGKGKLIRERAEIPDEVEEGDYDIDYYINNQVLPAVESIFSVFSISTNDMQGKKQKSLGEF